MITLPYRASTLKRIAFIICMFGLYPVLFYLVSLYEGRNDYEIIGLVSLNGQTFIMQRDNLTLAGCQNWTSIAQRTGFLQKSSCLANTADGGNSDE